MGVKKLEVRGEGAGGAGGAGEERTLAVGVSVRAGRGRYRLTNIVTLTPRYQLHNNTRHHLQFAQKCTATTLVSLHNSYYRILHSALFYLLQNYRYSFPENVPVIILSLYSYNYASIRDEKSK